MVIVNESVNLLNVAYILDSYTLNDMKQTWTKDPADCKKEFYKMRKYLKHKLSGNMQTKYSYGRGRSNGRQYGEDSIQNITGDVRNFIASGTTDIDLCNAHPVLLQNICINNDIHCSTLKDYVENRENKLQSIMEDDSINRDKAKEKVLIATNTNKHIKTNNTFLKNYSMEIKTIQKVLMATDEFKYLLQFANKEKGNMQGSFINHVLCVEEDKVLMLIKEKCEENGLEPFALMFDGLMIHGDVTEGFLKVIEDYVMEKTGFKCIKMAIKPPDTSFKIPDDYVPIVRKSYDQVKAEFQKNNCKVGCEFINESHGDITTYSRTNFVTLHESLVYFDEKKDKNVEFITEWFKDADKRQYDNMDIFPKASLCPSHTYNMWRPYPVENAKDDIDIEKCEKALEYFRNHIKVLCNHEDEVYKFVEMWIAQMFQYPEHKSMELVFISGEGAGKGMFLQFFKTIMGGNKKVWEVTDPQRDLYGNFNGMLRDAMIVCCNEANKAGTYNKNDQKKALITDETININIKGGRNYTMNSYQRFLTFTNNACPVVPNKRRDCIINSSDEKIGDKEYFNDGFKYANDIGACKYIYNYFMEAKTKPKLVGTDIPITEHHEMMIEEHEKIEIKFIKAQSDLWDEDVVKLTPDEFYGLFREFCINEQIENGGIKNKMSFAVKISGLRLGCIDKKVKKIDGKAINLYTIDVVALKAKYGI